LLFRADELEENAMIAIGVPIFQERRRLADVQEKDVNVAGVKTSPKAAPRRECSGSAARPDSFETFVEGAVRDYCDGGAAVRESGAGFQSVDLRIDVAVGDEDVEPGVVIHVEKSGAPADVGVAGLAHAGSPTDVVETLRTHIAIERVGLLLEVGNKEAETPAVVVIAPVDSHVAEFQAIATEGYAGKHAHVG